jgi:hypothetical protein
MILDDDQLAVILDGLGRISGFLDTYESGEEGKEAVRKLVVPVTFYAPGEDRRDFDLARDGQQLFADFNFRVNPVPVRLALERDEYDPYVQLANQLAEKDFIANHGGMVKGVASVSKSSTNLVTQQTLNRVVRGACEGRTFQESNVAFPPAPNLRDDTEQIFLDSISLFFGAIADKMGDTRWEDHDSLHLSSPGWQALALLFHDIHVTLNHNLEGVPKFSQRDYNRFIAAIAGIDWTRSNRKVWVEDLKLGIWYEPTPEDIEKDPNARSEVRIRGAGRTTTQAIHNYLREITGVANFLELMEDSRQTR